MAKNKVFIGYDYDNDKAAKDRLLEWVNKEFRLLFLRPVLRRRGGQRAAIGQDAVAVGAHTGQEGPTEHAHRTEDIA